MGALDARKYMRVLACACTNGRWVDMPPASRNSLGVMCFQLSFRGRVREARRLARATGLASINREALFLIPVPRDPPRRLEIYWRWFVRTKYRLSVRCEDNVRDNAYSHRAANSSNVNGRSWKGRSHETIAINFCAKISTRFVEKKKKTVNVSKVCANFI